MLAIEIVARGDGFLGRLRVDELDGTSSSREVGGSRCEEVASALALVTALTIDAGPTPSLTLEDEAASLHPVLRPSPPPLPAPASLRAPDGARSPGPRLRVEVGALGGAFGGLAPDLSGGVVPFVDWSRWGRSGVAPSLRFAIAFAASPTATTQDHTAAFLWLAARLSACPLALTLGPFTGRPCAGIDGGLLHGQGGKIQSLYGWFRPWIAPTLSARTQWAVTARARIEVEGGLVVPLIRDQFAFEPPPSLAHTAPAISGFATVGIGFLFGSPAPSRFP
jgi:hypothetical protein